MRYDHTDDISKAIQGEYELPLELTSLRASALFDLYFGSSGTDPGYPGYTETLKQLRRWAETELPSVLYYDPDSGEVLTKEPRAYTIEGEVDEDGEPIWFEPSPYFEVSRHTIWSAVFGALADNGL